MADVLRLPTAPPKFYFDCGQFGFFVEMESLDSMVEWAAEKTREAKADHGSEQDRVVWHQGRIRAVTRITASGEVEVTRFD